MLNSSYSLQNISNPYKDSLPLKFPKKCIRKQTKANMLTQTMYKFFELKIEPWEILY